MNRLYGCSKGFTVLDYEMFDGQNLCKFIEKQTVQIVDSDGVR